MKKVSFVLIFIIMAALSFWAGRHYGKGPSGDKGTPGERAILYYSDPMNPGFRSDEPGIAPCGMPLEPVYADAGEGLDASAMSLPPGAVKISLARQQLIGVKVAPVRKSPMTYNLRLYGRVVPDETTVYRVNASTDSWIRELSDVTTGSIVNRDQILAEALAPAYFNAQVTYLIALDNIDRIQQQLGGQLRHQQTDLADNQIRLSVQALQNLGITDAQMEELANTRKAQPYLQVRSPVRGVVLSRSLTRYQWFKAGQEFYSIADIGKVWVYADVYEDEARHLSPGMKVKVVHAQMGRTFPAKVSEVLPLFDPVSKTLKVRLDVENPRYDLRPDMFVDVEIPITMPSSLNVPADAVIDSGTKTIVYVDAGDGVFEPRRVGTGWKLGRRIEITKGLLPGENVVVSGNFLIDSESRMKTAASGERASTAKDPVCGMDVDVEKAENSGRTFELAGRKYYFCSDYCLKLFRKDPEKYIKKEMKKEMPVRTEHSHAEESGPDPSWLEALKPARSSRGMVHASAEREKDSKDDTLPRSAMTPGIVDWDGPDPEGNGAPARDWGAWGKFPGAKYLGLEDEKKTPRQQDVEGSGIGTLSVKEQTGPADAPTAARRAWGSRTEDEKRERPVFGRPDPPASQ